VSNSASVVTVAGADELDYSYISSGGLVGNGSGMDQALGSGNLHTLTLQTSNSGSISGSVRVQSPSEAAANPDQSLSISTAVLEHARPSFNSSTEHTSLSLDFGTTDLNHPIKLSLLLSNLTVVPNFTAALDLDQVVATGANQMFTTPILIFNGLSAGSSKSFELTFSPTAQGNFTANYRLQFSDEDLLGEQNQELTLTLHGVAVPEPGTLGNLLIAIVFLLRTSRYRYPRHPMQ
jgi:hypothetical protein